VARESREARESTSVGAWLSSLVVAWALLGGMSDPRQLSMQESFGRAGQRSGVVRPTAQRPRASRVVYGANGDTRLDEMQGWVFEDEGEETNWGTKPLS